MHCWVWESSRTDDQCANSLGKEQQVPGGTRPRTRCSSGASTGQLFPRPSAGLNQVTYEDDLSSGAATHTHLLSSSISKTVIFPSYFKGGLNVQNSRVGVCMPSNPTPGPHMPDTHLLGHMESADSQTKPVFGYTQQKPILADLSREGRNLLEKMGWC